MATPGTHDPQTDIGVGAVLPPGAVVLDADQARALFEESDRAEEAGGLPNGFEIQDPGLRNWVLQESTDLEKTLRKSAERKEDLTPEEREYEDFKELKRHLASARAVETSLEAPEETQDPRLKKAARYNITRIGALATEMMDADAGAEHPVRQTMDRLAIDPNIINDLADARRGARETAPDAGAEQWRAQYEAAEESLEQVRSLTEDKKLEQTLEAAAKKSRAKRNIAQTWANTDRTLSENTQNAIRETFEGKGHDDDLLAAMKLLQIGHGIASPVVGSTLGTAKSGIAYALLPAVHAARTLTGQWSVRENVAAERLPEEVVRENAQAFEVVDGGKEGEGRRTAEEIDQQETNPAVERKRAVDRARKAAARFESTIAQMPRSLRTRIAREMEADGGTPPEWNALSGTSPTKRRARSFVAGRRKGATPEQSTLADALEHGTGMPPAQRAVVEAIEEKIAERLGRVEPGESAGKSDVERIEGAREALKHMSFIEIAHEQLAQAGRNAQELLRNPVAAEHVAKMEEGNQLLLQQTKEFTILALPNEHGRHPDELSCEEVAIRTETAWERLDTKTRKSMSMMSVPEREGGPKADNGYRPAVGTMEEARWTAQAGEKLVKEVRTMKNEIASSTRMTDPKLFASRATRTQVKEGPERD